MGCGRPRGKGRREGLRAAAAGVGMGVGVGAPHVHMCFWHLEKEIAGMTGVPRPVVPFVPVPITAAVRRLLQSSAHEVPRRHVSLHVVRPSSETRPRHSMGPQSLGKSHLAASHAFQLYLHLFACFWNARLLSSSEVQREDRGSFVWPCVTRSWRNAWLPAGCCQYH